MILIILCWLAQVQSKWSNLLSIFVGSADIRTQLPEESKRSVQRGRGIVYEEPNRKVLYQLRIYTDIWFGWKVCILLICGSGRVDIYWYVVRVEGRSSSGLPTSAPAPRGVETVCPSSHKQSVHLVETFSPFRNDQPIEKRSVH